VGDSATAKFELNLLNKEDALTVADGNATKGMTVTVTDVNNNPVKGQHVYLRSADANMNIIDKDLRIINTATTDDKGRATVWLTSTASGQLEFKVSLKPNFPQNETQTKLVEFIADKSTAKLALTFPNKSTAAANGKAAIRVTVTVTDKHENRIDSQKVYFKSSRQEMKILNSASTNATNLEYSDNGIVTVMLTSTAAGQYDVTASLSEAFEAVNGKTVSGPVTFIGDSATAKISGLNLADAFTVADGKATNEVTVTVVDANNNPVKGQHVYLRTNDNRIDIIDDTSVVIKNATTNAQGTLTVKLKSTGAGDFNFTASLDDTFTKDDKMVHHDVKFIADKSTAHITLALENKDPTVANGNDSNQVTVIAIDKNGNVINNQEIYLSAGNSPMKIFNGKLQSTNLGVTDLNGIVKVLLKSDVAGEFNFTASLRTEQGDKSENLFVTFIADEATAQFDSKVLKVVVTNSEADGKTANVVQAKVIDGQGNPVSGKKVDFKISNGDMVPEPQRANEQNAMMVKSPKVMEVGTRLTNEAGIAELGLTLLSGSYTDVNVTASITNQLEKNNKSEATVTFKANTKAQFASLIVVGADNDKAANDKAANGKAAHSVIATVVDGNGKPLPDVIIKLTATNGAVVGPIAPTDNDGKVTVTLTNVKSGNSEVTAKVGAGDKPGVNTKVVNVNFIADIETLDFTIVATKNDVEADGLSTHRVTIDAFDANGNKPLDAEFKLSLPSALMIKTVNDKVYNAGDKFLTMSDKNNEGKIILDIASKDGGLYNIEAILNSKEKTTTVFFMNLIDETKSSVSLPTGNAAKILNNGNDGTNGNTALTIKLIGKNNKPINNMEGELVLTDLNGDIIEGLTVSDFRRIDDQGNYTAMVSSTADVAGSYNKYTGMKLVFKKGTNYNPTVNNTLTVYTYKFKINIASKSIGRGMIFQYVILATPSDAPTSKPIELTGLEAKWSTNNSRIARFDKQDGIVRGVVAGQGVIITAMPQEKYNGVTVKGTVNGGFTSMLSVSEIEMSPIFGDNKWVEQSKIQQYFIEPPRYILHANGGEVVDGIGKAGGDGGHESEILDIENVTKISIYPCTYQWQRIIGQLIFHYSNNKAPKYVGSRINCMKYETGNSPYPREYNIPEGKQFIGFNGWDSSTTNDTKYLGAIQFFVTDK